MKIFDISQELFHCAVFPGDEPPVRRVLESFEDGSIYNLTALSMCAHNGTHIDAPYHFYKDGKTIDQLSLEEGVYWLNAAPLNLGQSDGAPCRAVLIRK